MITKRRARRDPAAFRPAVEVCAILSACALLAACAPAEETPGGWQELAPAEAAGAERIRASVRFLELEGGVWVLASGDTNYNPRNLPEEFRADGRAVEADVVVLDDVASIAMVGPVVDIVRIRTAGETPLPRSEAAEPALWGTDWVLVEIEGGAVVEPGAATLSFPEAGRVAGSGSCNRFMGAVEVDGRALSFGPLALTRMACGSPLDEQETRYTAALDEALRYALIDGDLLLYGEGEEPILRFTN